MKPRSVPARHLLVGLCIILTALHNVHAGRKKRGANSAWTEWSVTRPCSRTCGGGIEIKQRNCVKTWLNSKPLCDGPDQMYVLCNTQPCPQGSVDPRVEQCQNYRWVDETEEWLPYYGAPNKCELNCLSTKDTSHHFTVADKVIDGTPCDLHSTDVCVDGVCRSVGCDGVIDSTKKRDLCGVCDGNNSTCNTYAGNIETYHLKTGYNDVLMLPVGTTSLSVTESSDSRNQLSLRDLEGKYYINNDGLSAFLFGNKKPEIQNHQDIIIGNDTFHYEIYGHKESLTADGPLKQVIFVVIIKQIGLDAVFRYKYSIPAGLTTEPSPTYPPQARHSWQVSEWSQCSRHCAGGVQTREVVCTGDTGKETDEYLCNPVDKPANIQQCNIQPCAARWHTSEWQSCSTTCGKGIQVRTISCKQLHANDVDTTVSDSECRDPKPPTTQNCNEYIPCPKWIVGKWSKCTKTCGTGRQVRNVLCKTQYPMLSEILPPQRCGDVKPAESQTCNQGPCYVVEWIVSDWSGCHATCNQSTETRQVVCSTRTGQIHEDQLCEQSRRPASKRPCSPNLDLCQPKPEWHASQWSNCSAHCGDGIQQRDVVCALHDKQILKVLPDDKCDPHQKMSEEQQCKGTDCHGDWFTGPFGKCSATCGGGQRHRELFCFINGVAVDLYECNNTLRPPASEDCNMEACIDDDLILIGGCRQSPYGCCPDGITAAEGPYFLGCPSQDRIPAGFCIESEFGCCLDGITPALGPFNFGCSNYTCKDSTYGCCQDGQTPASGPKGEGCPEYYTCQQTAFGCCPDGIHAARGLNGEGCKELAKPHCINTVFGCCEDGKTPAQGPDMFGCDQSSGEVSPCEFTKFGCCFDGITPARGPQGEGCNDIDCQTSTYGCCPDGITSALGEDFKGCPDMFVPEIPFCATSQYGCCPNGYTPATGPHQEGCDLNSCVDSTYGCCPDGMSPAEGPNNKGCQPLFPSCLHTKFGCCPYDNTPALGPEYQGCSGVLPGDCKHTMFGCCPDGVSYAKGPGYAGCLSCDQTAYGCCLDGVSVATGPHFEGCLTDEYFPSCKDTPYGCCSDGMSEAQGPNNAGCPDIVNKGVACGLPAEEGFCFRYVMLWMFDASYGVCKPFWYSGCEGNENRFQTKELCMEQCVKPNGLERCYLPKSTGICKLLENKYYYNYETGQCEIFLYGGCDGNTNRFETLEECQQACVLPHTRDTCNQPVSEGPCKGLFKRWYFDEVSQTCKEFFYGGCLGNDNNFETKEDCEGRCLSPLTKVCTLKKDPGPCTGRLMRWYFNQDGERCESFQYGGCGGNTNRFSTLSECQNTCLNLATSEEDICTLPADPGPCNTYSERWFYNQDTGLCERFSYGGCEGNSNRFETETHCRQQCNAAPSRDVCSLPQDTGECFDHFPMWYYDVSTSQCVQFIYTGCGGNANRFSTKAECKANCEVKKSRETGLERCYQPVDPGPCLQSLVRWHYDRQTQTCRRFEYGGCQGNINRFLTLEDCLSQCGNDRDTPTSGTSEPTVTTATSTTTTTAKDVCSLPQDMGECFDHFPMWYYDVSTSQCVQFIYTGCGGNANRFSTKAECKANCEVKKSRETGLDICALNVDSGPCQIKNTRYHYDRERGRCLRFIYGGCQGNENNFITKNECEVICPVKEICQLPKEQGACHGNKIRYYYNTVTQACEEFVYTGCQGNANRFKSLDNCNKVCGETMKETFTPQSTIPGYTTKVPSVIHSDGVCSLLKDPGPCRGYNAVWYFEPNTRTCRRFLYGGCQGNENRFDTREECQQRCLYTELDTTQTSLTTTTQQSVHTEPGYDGSLVPGSSGAELPTDDDTDFAMCLEEKGNESYCTGWEIKWYFERQSASCRQFYYGGCNGNNNRFNSEEDCRKTCLESQQTSSEDICYLPPSKGPCFAEQQRWYFDNINGKCKDFIYGGCQGNGNRFLTKENCELVCKFASKEDVCSQPKVIGPCQAFQLRYYFDKKAGQCVSFQFGGCQGNQNNFETEKECYQVCSEHMVEENKKKTKDDCRLSKQPGPCQADFTRFFFDQQSGLCRPFTYGGCQGNGNNFETQKDCYDTCVDDEKIIKQARIYVPGDCYDVYDTGSCDDAVPRWYFDHNKGDCQAFYFSGCEGNGNNFLHYEDCVAFCSKISETCGVLQCNLDCPFGFSRRPDGCPLCECRDPCLTYQCPEDQECHQERVACLREPCKPQLVCKPKPKPGECPLLVADNSALCVTECQQDADCRDDAKCCPNGCGLVCVVPYVPECQVSVFGCCPDGETKATGWNLIGCPEESPIIEEGGQIEIVSIAGKTVVIPCVAKGAPTPQITWYKSRFPLVKKDAERMTQQEDGSLKIDNVQPEDSTSYTCRAFNNVGSATKTYSLLVQVPVTIIKISAGIQVNPGDDIKLTCVTRGNPVPEVRWLHGDKVIHSGHKRHFIDKHGTLMIERAVLSDEGDYMCEANNGVGEPVTASTYVDVLGPFKVKISAHNKTIDIGSDLRLVCEVTGDLTDVTLHWFKDGFPLLDDDDNNRIKVTPEGELLVEDMMKSDEGKYTCSAKRFHSKMSKSTTIYTKGVELPDNCIDKPWYANCKLIIEARMCRHAYFKIFCCQSCYEAGLLP